MNTGSRLLGIIGVSVLLAGGSGLAAEPGHEALPGIAPETVTNYLHAVIEADRTFYTIHVVERMQNRGGVAASETWRADNRLPLPAQFLMESGDLAAKTGSAVRYRLISLWPINPQNRAVTEVERQGLEQVARHPERPATAVVANGDVKEFQAIYADRAITQACVACHNADARSPKRDFALHDVMGGLLITIPLGPASR
jgi:mono/diheme cytochrome c family protein